MSYKLSIQWIFLVLSKWVIISVSDSLASSSFYDSVFSITQEMLLQLNEDMVKSFYEEHAAKSFFSSLVQYMTGGPVLIMVFEKTNAVVDWRSMIGPIDANKAKVTHRTSVRAFCGLDSQRNCVHGSDSPKSAAREILFLFERISSSASRSTFAWFPYSFRTCYRSNILIAQDALMVHDKMFPG